MTEFAKKEGRLVDSIQENSNEIFLHVFFVMFCFFLIRKYQCVVCNYLTDLRYISDSNLQAALLNYLL